MRCPMIAVAGLIAVEVIIPHTPLTTFPVSHPDRVVR